jgi:hypothetical protein
VLRQHFYRFENRSFQSVVQRVAANVGNTNYAVQNHKLLKLFIVVRYALSSQPSALSYTLAETNENGLYHKSPASEIR